MSLPLAPGLSLPVSGIGLPSHCRSQITPPPGDPPNGTPTATDVPPSRRDPLGGGPTQADAQPPAPFARYPHRPPRPWGKEFRFPKLNRNVELRVCTRPVRSPCLSTRPRFRVQALRTRRRRRSPHGWGWPPRSRNFIPRVRTETAETARARHEFPR